MSPKAFVENSQHDYSTDCDCPQCILEMRRIARQHAALMHGGYPPPRPVEHWWRVSANTIICSSVIAGCLVAVVLLWPSLAHAHAPRPVAAPESLVRARAACPNGATPVKCRAALRRAYAAVEWQRRENLKLAREMVGKLTDWTCIHQGEGAWNSHTGNGYYGGLQFDATFERTYGRDMIQRYHGHADQWPPRKQIIVAQRAYKQNRGYNPWPNTARACGLR